MAEMDILLDDYDDVEIADGDFVIGDSLFQEVKNIIRLIPGQIKFAPRLGPNLVRLINSKVTNTELRNIIKRNLEADGKDYERIKELITLKTK